MRFHGGNREARLDFSSNTNPLGPPRMLYTILRKCIKNISTIEKYPDYNYTILKRTIARFYNCSTNYIITSNGAAEAINLAIIALKPRRLVVLEPSYGEYEDLAKVLGIEYINIDYVKLNNSFYLDLSKLKNFCEDGNTLIALTNPNNPTGSYIPIEKIIYTLGNCKSRILIDEAYAELCISCPIELDYVVPSNFIIIRSLTKWLSIPGLRIGFAYVPDEDLFNKIDTIRQPWNINGITECVIVNILKYVHEMKNFINESRKYIQIEKNRVINILRSLGLQVFDSVTNFLLIDLGINSNKIISAIERRGITVRSCKSFKGLGSRYIRISIRRVEENNELINVLSEEITIG